MSMSGGRRWLPPLPVLIAAVWVLGAGLSLAVWFVGAHVADRIWP